MASGVLEPRLVGRREVREQPLNADPGQRQKFIGDGRNFFRKKADPPHSRINLDMDYRVLPLRYGRRAQSPGENDIGTGGGDVAPDILPRNVIRRRPQDKNRLADACIPQFDRLIRDYLTIKNSGNIPRIDEVYVEFKNHVRLLKSENIKNIVADIYRYSKYFVNLAFLKEDDEDIRKILSDIKDLKVDVAYPFLLQVYDDYKQLRICLLYTSPSPRDRTRSRMPSSA